MTARIITGEPCVICELPMVPNTRTATIPAGYVMHRAMRKCSTCYKLVEDRRRRARAAFDGVAVERVTDRLTTERLPVEPLLAWLALLGNPKSHTPLWRAVERGRKHGYVSVASADRIAVQVLRAHPAEIWGEAWWGNA